MIPPISRLMARHLFGGPLTDTSPLQPSAEALQQVAARLADGSRRRLGRSLAIREVDAGSCNGCELEIHAANHPVYDLERFGLSFVASPRHADVLLITGPMCRNMAEAARRTYDAAPNPKWVVALGDCACDGGCFGSSYATLGGAAELLPVDLRIPGCPPSPVQILSGLLALIEP